MDRWASWLSVLIALASPWLAQERAAYGLAHSLAEVGRAYAFESAEEQEDEAYGGLDLITVSAEASPVALDASALPGHFAPLSALHLARPTRPILPPDRAPRKWPASSDLRRFAWLQSFLF
jgi:hypothetical protein